MVRYCWCTPIIVDDFRRPSHGSGVHSHASMVLKRMQCIARLHRNDIEEKYATTAIQVAANQRHCLRSCAGDFPTGGARARFIHGFELEPSGIIHTSAGLTTITAP